MSNTPEQQATLYRKAAETIEMCAKHGIDATVKVNGNIFLIFGFGFTNSFDCYEFPIAVISGQLIWKGTPVYDPDGEKIEGELADIIIRDGKLSYDGIWYYLIPYTLTPPKRTVMVELLVEDAEQLANRASPNVGRIRTAMRKALDNLNPNYNNLDGLQGGSERYPSW